MERTLLIIALAIVFVGIGIGLLLTNRSSAISLPGVSLPSLPGVSSNISFGGKIESSKRCDILCDDFQGHLIHVGPPKGGDFVTNFSSKVYRENNFSEGNYVVGLAKDEEIECKGVTKKKGAVAVIRCFFGDCDPKNACEDHGKGKVITKIGTSK